MHGGSSQSSRDGRNECGLVFQSQGVRPRLRAAAAELDHLAAAAAQSGMPPSSTGRASTPCAARIPAAIPARAPDSQIVTTGRSVVDAGAERASSRYGMLPAARDVAAVALVRLADVEHLALLPRAGARARRARPARAARAARRHVSPSSSRKPTACSRRATRRPPRRELALHDDPLVGSSTKPAFVPNAEPETGHVERARDVAGREVGASRTSSTVAPAGVGGELSAAPARRRTGRG